MATDHFKKHSYQKGSIDWNFNILFDDQPQVGKAAKKFAQALDHPGLHAPIPVQWLHMTILRVGYTTDYTDAEMAEVAKRLAPKLEAMNMPELVFGSWIIFGGTPNLIAAPWDKLEAVFAAVMDTMKEVAGAKRCPSPERFIPHMALAYGGDYDTETKLVQRLWEAKFKLAPFRANKLSMIKQQQAPPYYRWDVIEEIPIGQSS